MFWKKKKVEVKEAPSSCPPNGCSSCSVEASAQSSCATEKGVSNQINNKQTSYNQIKHFIAIGSGKGGVGKSTVTSNLAHALKLAGFKVGVLDADIYGPTQEVMLGSNKEKAMAFDGMIKPIIKDNIKYISMSNLIRDNRPTIWRAPIAVQAIEQFLHGVHWGELDYLLVDLPPGTGDIQLTICQQVQLSGAIIVSTPQKVAVSVAQNGLKMFKDLNVPILGIVENMANFSCSSCHTKTKLYKGNLLQQVAKQEKTQLICSIPLDENIMQACDEGKSIFSFGKEYPSAIAYTELANTIKKKLNVTSANNIIDLYKLGQNGELEIIWKDGKNTTFSAYELRNQCQCAFCVDEITGKKVLKAEEIHNDIKITDVSQIGLYGMGIQFSDGHDSGIYQINNLRN